MWYSLLADLIVALHLAYVSFVVLGQIAILIGAIARWSWVRNFWFRTLHLSMMLVVAIEAVFGIECPMTTWETQLRSAAGEVASGESFVARLVHSIMFPDCPTHVFEKIYFGVAALIVGTFLLVPPRREKRSWLMVLGAPLLMIGLTFTVFIQWNIGVALAGVGFVLVALGR